MFEQRGVDLHLMGRVCERNAQLRDVGVRSQGTQDPQAEEAKARTAAQHQRGDTHKLSVRRADGEDPQTVADAEPVLGEVVPPHVVPDPGLKRQIDLATHFEGSPIGLEGGHGRHGLDGLDRERGQSHLITHFSTPNTD